MGESGTPPMLAAWARLWTLPAACADATLRFYETVALAPIIMQARLPIIQAGLVDPWTADYVELNRMMSEKIDAWSQSAATFQADMAALARRSPSSEPAQFLTNWMQMVDAAWRIPGRSQRPVHRAVLANHRRLRRLTVR
jgi:hypothetical protein